MDERSQIAESDRSASNPEVQNHAIGRQMMQIMLDRIGGPRERPASGCAEPRITSSLSLYANLEFENSRAALVIIVAAQSLNSRLCGAPREPSEFGNLQPTLFRTPRDTIAAADLRDSTHGREWPRSSSIAGGVIGYASGSDKAASDR